MSQKALIRVKVNGEWKDVKVTAIGSDDKVSMPASGNQIDYGTAGQFAVSDGKGGITWKTLVEAEGVGY